MYSFMAALSGPEIETPLGNGGSGDQVDGAVIGAMRGKRQGFRFVEHFFEVMITCGNRGQVRIF